MKAIRQHTFGAPEVLQLEEVPDPEAGPGQVVVKVHAAGVNPVEPIFGQESTPSRQRLLHWAMMARGSLKVSGMKSKMYLLVTACTSPGPEAAPTRKKRCAMPGMCFRYPNVQALPRVRLSMCHTSPHIRPCFTGVVPGLVKPFLFTVAAVG